MQYNIVFINSEGRKLISRHSDLEEAKKAGKAYFEKTKRGEAVICMSGKIDDDGNIEGKYILYEAWT